MNIQSLNYEQIINSIQTQYHNFNQPIPIHFSLNQIYADIQGQLCSKQSTLLNKLKNGFAKLYDGLIPQHFIMVNQIIQLTNGMMGNILGKQISFAMENGIIIAVKKTYQGQNIFINGSLLEQQLEYTCQGKIIKLDSFKKSASIKSNQLVNKLKLQKKIEQIIDLVSQQLAINKLFGGVIYIYSNIKETVSYFQQKILLGIYLTGLLINGQIGQLNINQIYQRLKSKQNLFTDEFLQCQLLRNYNKRQILISQIKKNEQMQEQIQNNINLNINLDKKKKFIFYDIGLSNQTLKNIKQQKNKVMNKLTSNKIKNLIQIKEKINQIFSNQQNYISKISINQIFKSIKDFSLIKNPQLCYYSQQLISMIEQDLKTIPNLQYLIIEQGQYIIFCVNSHQTHELIRNLRKLIKLQQQNPQNQNLEKRFGNRQILKIDQKIFSCVPSLNLAILNPENQMWFR